MTTTREHQEKSELAGGALGRFTIGLIPFALAGAPLLWFSFGAGDAWAHGLFGQRHPLNLGGNPAEIFSHLLNGIVMATGINALGVFLLASRSDTSGSTRRQFALAVTGTVGVALWAMALDGRSGEGTVPWTFLLFFGPALAGSSVGAWRLLRLDVASRYRAIAAISLWLISLGLIWFYEPSDSGGPNLLVLPLLAFQVALFWMVPRVLRDMAPPAPFGGPPLAPASKSH